MRRHWENCIVNFDNQVEDFIGEYFSEKARRVLLVAAAGFDPRSQRVSQILSASLDERLAAYYIREERAGASETLLQLADKQEQALKAIVPQCQILHINVFADDGAPVGGSRIVSLLEEHGIPDDVTDVILDLSTLSIGVGFPAARLLLEDCEANVDRTFHLMIVSNPEMEDLVDNVPGSRPGSVRGFSPPIGATGEDLAQVWIPQLTRGRMSSLTQIGADIGRCYKICPLLPFPARNPRRADDLIAEYRTALVDEWQVDPRDVVYASEWNPLDCYRTLSTLKARLDRTMQGTYEPRMILSPVGSKLLATGALMAAIDHGMAVHFLETEAYELNSPEKSAPEVPDMTVHLILSGPIYRSYET